MANPGKRMASPEAMAEVSNVLRQQVRCAFQSAVQIGIPAREFLEVLSQEARPYLEEPFRSGYAGPEEGLAAMLEAEGGCVDLDAAAALATESKEILEKKVRVGELIAYRTAIGQLLVPRWQFRPGGGLLKGMPEVLRRLREIAPTADDLFPFTFFLQFDPLLARTPLEALRTGEAGRVIEALEAFSGLMSP